MKTHILNIHERLRIQIFFLNKCDFLGHFVVPCTNDENSREDECKGLSLKYLRESEHIWIFF